MVRGRDSAPLGAGGVRVDRGHGLWLVGHNEVVAGGGAHRDEGAAEEETQRLARGEWGCRAALVPCVDGNDNVRSDDADGSSVAAVGDHGGAVLVVGSRLGPLRG